MSTLVVTSLRNPSAATNAITLDTSGNALVPSLVPPGTVQYFAGSTAPAGWVKANGAALSRTTYADLFAAISTTFGAGDGSTTFNLPDLRGEFLRGWADGRAVDTGRVFGSAQTDAMQGHKHQANRSIPMRLGADGAYDARSLVALVDDCALFDLASQMQVDPVTDGTNGTPRTAAETRSRNIALLTIIKF